VVSMCDAARRILMLHQHGSAAIVAVMEAVLWAVAIALLCPSGLQVAVACGRQQEGGVGGL
jgi:hypothetical protein